MTGFNLPDGCNDSDLPGDGDCPQCGSDTGVKYPRVGSPYCEDCGWPDDDFGQE